MDHDATYFRKGFGLKGEVQETLDADYSGRLVDVLRDHGFALTVGDTTVRLAREFGFCYGVERAVDYAYQTRAKFPGRRVVLVGEIIHNPHVNAKLRAMGVEILMPGPDGFDYSRVAPDDVVILPAFGVTIRDFDTLRGIGCVMVDTTCGSVLNVWKRVEGYARDGYTALIHGKHYHEETRATASQVSKYPGGAFIVVRDMAETRQVCDYIEGRGEREAFLARFAHAASPGFDPDIHLRRIGVANQTTMLASESLAIAAEVGMALERAHGPEYRAANFRSFDTICSATQERQDAVKELLAEPLDVMVVVGGYNSSNTMSLAAICAERVTTYHVEDATCLDVEQGTIRHKPIGKPGEIVTGEWLAMPGPVRVGITAGASTPNNKIGDAIARIFATRGVDPHGAA
ncbi:MAG TPA: 4-hydroxy-3-methylbut-2-enyl diphosphate reductase [Gemmatimonadaceae bacterium]|nr:4-hydroxy-3-methylbut-2-enyl diphosphate reductase [Gemmatimonadaceae bacterium]